MMPSRAPTAIPPMPSAPASSVASAVATAPRATSRPTTAPTCWRITTGSAGEVELRMYWLQVARRRLSFARTTAARRAPAWSRSAPPSTPNAHSGDVSGSGILQLSDAVDDGDGGADGEQGDGHDEGPEPALSAVAGRVSLVGLAPRPAGGQQEEELAAGAGRGLDAHCEHRRRLGDDGGGDRGAGDDDAGERRDDDRPRPVLTSTGHGTDGTAGSPGRGVGPRAGQARSAWCWRIVATAAVTRLPVGTWRNSLGPWAFEPGTRTPVITNWAAGKRLPSMAMNGMVPPTPTAPGRGAEGRRRRLVEGVGQPRLRSAARPNPPRRWRRRR